MTGFYLDLVGETDARKWASAFAATFPHVLKEGQGVVNDVEGLMLGWFANAIEAGRFAESKKADEEWTDLLDQAGFFELKPGDTLVLHYNRPYMGASEAREIVARFNEHLPNNKLVIVVADELEIRPVEESSDKEWDKAFREWSEAFKEYRDNNG